MWHAHKMVVNTRIHGPHQGPPYRHHPYLATTNMAVNIDQTNLPQRRDIATMAKGCLTGNRNKNSNTRKNSIQKQNIDQTIQGSTPVVDRTLKNN